MLQRMYRQVPFYKKRGIDPAKRTHIKMSAIKGRADDMLIIRGVNLFYTQVEEIIQDFSFLAPNYQLIVSRNQTLDEVLVKVEVAEGLDHQYLDYAQQFLKKIKNTIGLSMQVQLYPNGSIPMSQGGKLKRIIDQRKK